MDNYLLFLFVATVTVMSPGPGVILTLTNTMRYGVLGATGGILGLAFGTFIVAGISATSLGVLLKTSAIAFSFVKYVGAVYLIYLGVKLIRSKPTELDHGGNPSNSLKTQFLAGLGLQLTNPKVVFFFMSVFPQFISLQQNYVNQFIILVMTYSSLIILIHFLYAAGAKKARNWITSDKGGRRVNYIGGVTFIGFGIGLASASR